MVSFVFQICPLWFAKVFHSELAGRLHRFIHSIILTCWFLALFLPKPCFLQIFTHIPETQRVGSILVHFFQVADFQSTQIYVLTNWPIQDLLWPNNSKSQIDNLDEFFYLLAVGEMFKKICKHFLF